MIKKNIVITLNVLKLGHGKISENSDNFFIIIFN